LASIIGALRRVRQCVGALLSHKLERSQTDQEKEEKMVTERGSEQTMLQVHINSQTTQQDGSSDVKQCFTAAHTIFILTLLPSSLFYLQAFPLGFLPSATRQLLSGSSADH
jgi:hypothetical protein